MAKRNSSIELLRIFCMMFIVMHHIIITSTLSDVDTPVYKFLDMLFHTAVVIFVLITGYFGIKFKFDRLLKLWFQIFFYSAGISLIAFFVLHTISIKEVIDGFFPIYRRPYWFMSSYFGLYLLAPALNIVVRNASRKQMLFFTIVLLCSNNFFTSDFIFGSGLSLFSLLYLIGRYLSKYKKDFLNSNKEILFYMLLYLLLCVPFFFLSEESWVYQKFVTFSYRYYGVGTIILSILFFYFFQKHQIQ